MLRSSFLNHFFLQNFFSPFLLNFDLFSETFVAFFFVTFSTLFLVTFSAFFFGTFLAFFSLATLAIFFGPLIAFFFRTTFLPSQAGVHFFTGRLPIEGGWFEETIGSGGKEDFEQLDGNCILESVLDGRS